MHVHGVNVALKCRLPGREPRWRKKFMATDPPDGRCVQNHQLALPVSAVWRHAHQLTRPELVGEDVRSLRVTPPCDASSVDLIFHRYTRQVILALPHTGAPGVPRVRREVAHA